MFWEKFILIIILNLLIIIIYITIIFYAFKHKMDSKKINDKLNKIIRDKELNIDIYKYISFIAANEPFNDNTTEKNKTLETHKDVIFNRLNELFNEFSPTDLLENIPPFRYILLLKDGTPLKSYINYPDIYCNKQFL